MSVEVNGVQFSDADIQMMRESVGAPVDLNPVRWGDAPKIDQGRSKITTPTTKTESGQVVNAERSRVTSINGTRFADTCNQWRAEEKAAATAEQERLSELEKVRPENLVKTLHALDRRLRKVEKENRELKQQIQLQGGDK